MILILIIATTVAPQTNVEISNDPKCFEITDFLLSCEEIKLQLNEIACLPPQQYTTPKANYALNPYVNTVKQPVHIARTHFKKDFKSLEIII